MRRVVKVTVETRVDGNTSVSSDELPGLILVGRDRTKILAAIEPAVRAILRHKGEEPRYLRIDASLSSQHQQGE